MFICGWKAGRKCWIGGVCVHACCHCQLTSTIRGEKKNRFLLLRRGYDTQTGTCTNRHKQASEIFIYSLVNQEHCAIVTKQLNKNRDSLVQRVLVWQSLQSEWTGSRYETQYHTVNVAAHVNTHTHTHRVSVGGITAGADTLHQMEQCSLQSDHIMLLIGRPNQERSLWDNTQNPNCHVYFTALVHACVYACEWKHSHSILIPFYITRLYSWEEIYGCLPRSNQVTFNKVTLSLAPLTGSTLSVKHNISSAPALHNSSWISTIRICLPFACVHMSTCGV